MHGCFVMVAAVPVLDFNQDSNACYSRYSKEDSSCVTLCNEIDALENTLARGR